MNNNRHQFIKLGVWGTGLPFFSVAIILTFLFIVTGGVRAADIQIKTQPSLPSPKIETCATYGYTCESGYSCTLDTRALGVPSITYSPDPARPSIIYNRPKYACTKSSITYEDGCPQGWDNRGGNVTAGEYTCKPVHPLCKTPETFPWPAPGYSQQGYFCLEAPDRMY